MNELARFITLYGTPTLLVFLGSYLVLVAFTHGSYVGMRSLSGVLLPIVLASFLYAFNRDLLYRLGVAPTWVGLFIGLALGTLVMIGVRWFAPQSVAPLSELLVSGCFSVLVFSSASIRDDRALSYYYGTLMGMLSYVVLFGFPLVNGSP